MKKTKAEQRRGSRTLIYDTETTGLLKPDIADLDQQPQIIEFAVVEVDATYKVVNTFSRLIKPAAPISAEITKITGLTNDDLFAAPCFLELLPEIEAVFLGVDRIIAHNLQFDINMLVNELKRVGREYAFPYPPNQVCTVQLAEELLYGRRAKLTELYKDTTGNKLEQSHRALDDVMALLEVVKARKW